MYVFVCLFHIFYYRFFFFFFNDTATTEIYTLSLHDALPISRSAASRLNLIQDQQDAPFVAKGPDLPQIVLRRDPYATLALDRLQQDRAGPVTNRCPQGDDVVERNIHEPLRKRGERGLILRFSCRGYHRQCSTMKTLQRRNNLIGAIQVKLPILPGQLDRPLVRLSAAVTNEDFCQTACRDQQLCQLDLRGRIDVKAGQDKSRCLLPEGLYNDRMTMAQATGGPSGNEVKVFSPGVIPDPRPLPTNERHPETPVTGIHEIPLIRLDPMIHAAPRSRNRARHFGPPPALRNSVVSTSWI